MDTVLTTIILGFIGVVVAGLVLVALMRLWFWMDEQERNDR
jgi:predicted permease